MALNFKISVHKNGDNLHLKLSGDFDGSSAFQLLNAMKKNSNGARRVLIHTACLGKIDPFGCEMFRHRLSELNKHGSSIIFTGKHAEQIAQEKACSFDSARP